MPTIQDLIKQLAETYQETDNLASRLLPENLLNSTPQEARIIYDRSQELNAIAKSLWLELKNRGLTTADVDIALNQIKNKLNS